MTDYEKVARQLAGGHYHVDDDCWYCCYACEDCCNDQKTGICNCGLEKRVQEIIQALRTAVEKERGENIKIVRDMDNRLYGDACMTAKFQKHIEEAIRNRGKDTPQNG